jgi:hypothetical protein
MKIKLFVAHLPWTRYSVALEWQWPSQWGSLSLRVWVTTQANKQYMWQVWEGIHTVGNKALRGQVTCPSPWNKQVGMGSHVGTSESKVWFFLLSLATFQKVTNIISPHLLWMRGVTRRTNIPRSLPSHILVILSNSACHHLMETQTVHSNCCGFNSFHCETFQLLRWFSICCLIWLHTALREDAGISAVFNWVAWGLGVGWGWGMLAGVKDYLPSPPFPLAQGE